MEEIENMMNEIKSLRSHFFSLFVWTKKSLSLRKTLLFHVASVEKAEPNRNLCWTLEVGTKEADNKLKMNPVMNGRKKRSRRSVKCVINGSFK